MNALSDRLSGLELANAIRAQAASLGKTILDFVAPISPTPCQWLAQLQRAAQPKPATVERVRQLLAGEPVSPPPPNNFQASSRKQPLFAAERTPIPSTPPVYRDPCWRCGVRGDIGCCHQVDAA